MKIIESLDKDDLDELFNIRDNSFPMLTDDEVRMLSKEVTRDDIKTGKVYDIFNNHYKKLQYKWHRISY